MRHEVVDPVFPGTDSAADRACATISGSTLAVTMRGGQGTKAASQCWHLMEWWKKSSSAPIVASTTSLATALAKRLGVPETWARFGISPQMSVRGSGVEGGAWSAGRGFLKATSRRKKLLRFKQQ